MRIIIKKGNWWQRAVRGMYDTKTEIVYVWDVKNIFKVLTHELGHHNFQLKYKNFPLWRKIISWLILEHELRASYQEGHITEIKFK